MSRSPAPSRPRCITAILLTVATAPLAAQGPPRLLAWNDLGMHCTDNDYSVFSILPPYNTFHAQLVVGGHLVTSGSYTVHYEAIADPSGSINTTSIGKTAFWQFAPALFGVTLPLDQGLAGFRMPGPGNVPQAMNFQPSLSDWIAVGVPITPHDDTGAMRPYPLMRLVARSPAGSVLATTSTVLPVSAEVACQTCHASGGNPAARPPSGWVYGPPATDDRWNILKLHDEKHLGEPLYTTSLAGAGYPAQGLLHSAEIGTPVLCARCHGSVALDAPGQPGVASMTSVMHTLHAGVRLPDGRTLEAVMDRTSCYTCHPGAATRCLRGAMGKAIGADGEPMMACQDCHGSMSEVGDPARTGWLEEPACQNCHTGDAVANAGQIRFDSAFDMPGHLRQTTNPRFATDANAPLPPFSLYRFSTGHGEVECSACHGSPHAIYPGNGPNDNLQSVATQGHVGTINECSACHSNLQDNQQIGPHGMHPTGQVWVDKHQDIAEQQGVASCQVCHGTTYRGTVLSRAQGDRTVTTLFGTRHFWRGYEVGCYECHNGPTSQGPSPNTPPVVTDRNASTPTDTPLMLTLTASDPNGDALTLRIVEQPQHGAVAFDGSHATYRAWDAYVGTDSFTYAASDNKSNSNLGTVTIAVGAPACAGHSEAYGYGCASQSGEMPMLDVTGCPTAGQQIVFTGTQLPTISFAVLAVGSGRGGIELGPDGCTLRLTAIAATSDVLPVAGGQFVYPLAIPAWLTTWNGTFQAFALAPAEPRGFVATRGLELWVQ